MSLIGKNNLNYITTVEQFFLSLKDSGLSLSANDYHLISGWEERGVPLNVVCRAIEKSLTEHINRNPNHPCREKVSLTTLEKSIESVIGQA
ncbi:MAG: hypothetical protein ACE5E9_14280 [Nitrospinaceae bacterium]